MQKFYENWSLIRNLILERVEAREQSMQRIVLYEMQWQVQEKDFHDGGTLMVGNTLYPGVLGPCEGALAAS